MKIVNSRRFGVKSNGQIFYRVKYSPGKKGQAQINIDFSVGAYAEIDKWDKELQRPMRGTRHKRGDIVTAASAIQFKMDKMADAVDSAFKAFEVEEVIPTSDMLRRVVNEELGRTKVAERIGGTKFLSAPTCEELLCKHLEYGKNILNWADGSMESFVCFKKHLSEVCGDKEITECTVDHMKEMQRKYTEAGVGNIRVKSAVAFARSFFRWCITEGYTIDPRIMEYKPRFKTADNEVVFLTKEEVDKLFNLNIKDDEKRLARDIFVFQCTTGLRYSDIRALKSDSVRDGVISHVIIKTMKHVAFKMNSYSAKIVKRYKGKSKEGLLLPTLPNIKQNKLIKEVCKMAGIDEPIVRVSYIGSKRIEKTIPKYQAIASHTGRRTFVSVALELGATSQQVMAITGHSTVDMMERYVGISEEGKSAASAAWDKKEDKKKELLAALSQLSVEELQKLLQER